MRPHAAAGWYDGFAHAINSLADMPQRCSLAPENDAFEEEIRQLLYGPRGPAYRALFTVEDDGWWVSLGFVAPRRPDKVHPSRKNGHARRY